MTSHDPTGAEPVTTRDDDARTVEVFGYQPELRRSMGFFSTFAISFSLMSITTGIFANYGFGLQQAGIRRPGIGSCPGGARTWMPM